MRDRGRGLRPYRAAALAVLSLLAVVESCTPPDPEFPPDEVLRSELGLTEEDEVHRVLVTGGEVELPEPRTTEVRPGAYVEFVTGDGLIHEVLFEVDSLDLGMRTFLERTDQVGSPPLILRDSRFVVSFQDAPEGRYPYRVEGNGGSGRGVVIVRARSSR